MNIGFKILVVLVLSFLIFFEIGRLYFGFTDGFRLTDIQAEIPYRLDWDRKTLGTAEQEEIDTALKGSYFYLKKDHQTYMFVSQNHKYLITFVKFHAMRQETMENLFNAWITEQTDALYVHINKSDLFYRSIVLYDKMGRRHDVNLDEAIFLLQHNRDGVV